MKYKAEVRIKKEVFENEYLKEKALRRVACMIVDELPLEEVKRLFNLKHYSGSDSEIVEFENEEQFIYETKNDFCLVTGEIEVD